MGIIDKQLNPAAAGPQQEAAEPVAEERNEAPGAEAQEAGGDVGDKLAAQGSATKLTIDAGDLIAQMPLEPAQRDHVERIVMAGRKVMYSPESKDLVTQSMQGDGGDAQKLGVAVAGLMGLLIQEGQGAIPGELMVPAGIALCAEGAAFMNEAGMDVTDQDCGQAIEVFMDTFLREAGLDPDKMAEMGAQAEAGGAPGAGGRPQPAGPPQGGLVGGAMQGAQ